MLSGLHKSYDIPIRDVLLPVAEILERREKLSDLAIWKNKAKILKLLPESMLAGMLPKDIIGLYDPDALRSHYLVSLGIGHHAMLVYPGLMGKRVIADYCLRREDLHACYRRKKTRRPEKLLCLDVGLIRIEVRTCLHCHDYLFKRGVSCPLTYSAERALDLPGPGLHASKGISHSKPEVIMAVH